MSRRNLASHLVGIAFTAAFVTGCGGDGSDDTDSPPTAGPAAEGVYGGTLSGSTSNSFQLLILEDDEFWAIYGSQGSTFFGVAGFIQGQGASNNGTYTSSNTKDFGFNPALSVNTNATYNATAKTISGTVASSNGTTSFSGGPIAGSLYNYATPASLTTITGSWATTSLTGERVSISIASSGSFTASSSLGCNFSGTVAPRPSGKNVFNVSLTFGAAPCALPGQAATGIALSYPLANGQTQLLVAVVDSSRGNGAAVFGTR